MRQAFAPWPTSRPSSRRWPPRPVNTLVASDFATLEELARIGVRRISVGGALARVAWTGFLQAAKEIAERGTFAELGRAVPFPEINARF